MTLEQAHVQLQEARQGQALLQKHVQSLRVDLQQAESDLTGADCLVRQLLCDTSAKICICFRAPASALHPN